jgi:hypothetical protein
MKPKRQYNEAKDVAAYFAWFKYQYPNIVAFKISNEGKRSSYFVKQIGILAGVPDIFVAKAIGSKNGLFIEMKASNGKGTLTKPQEYMIKSLNDADYIAEYCIGWESAKNLTSNYMNGLYK